MNIVKGDYVFVYGTLRRGERSDLSSESNRSRCRFVREDRINGDIYSIGWFPGLKAPDEVSPFNPDFHSVVGDLFKVREDTLGVILDTYEGYPHLYLRHKVHTESGMLAWVYTYTGGFLEEQLIPSGDWKQRQFKTIQSAAMPKARAS